MQFNSILSAVILSAMSLPAIAQDCPISDFRDTLNQTTDIETVVAIAMELSESEYEKSKQEAGGSGAFMGLLDFQADYGQFHETARSLAQSSHYFAQGSYQNSLVTTRLTEEGLQGYIACIQSRNGLRVYLKDISSERYIVQVLFDLQEGIRYPRNGLTRSVNVSGEITNQSEQSLTNNFSNSISSDINQEIVIEPNDRTRGVAITFSVGENNSRSIQLPPLNRPRAWRVSGNRDIEVTPDGAENSVYFRQTIDLGDLQISDYRFFVSGGAALSGWTVDDILRVDGENVWSHGGTISTDCRNHLGQGMATHWNFAPATEITNLITSNVVQFEYFDFIVCRGHTPIYLVALPRY